MRLPARKSAGVRRHSRLSHERFQAASTVASRDAGREPPFPAFDGARSPSAGAGDSRDVWWEHDDASWGHERSVRRG